MTRFKIPISAISSRSTKILLCMAFIQTTKVFITIFVIKTHMVFIDRCSDLNILSPTHFEQDHWFREYNFWVLRISFYHTCKMQMHLYSRVQNSVENFVVWSKMPMFQRTGMREGGLPLPPAFQYLILMTWSACYSNLVTISSLHNGKALKLGCPFFSCLMKWNWRRLI